MYLGINHTKFSIGRKCQFREGLKIETGTIRISERNYGASGHQVTSGQAVIVV